MGEEKKRERRYAVWLGEKVGSQAKDRADKLGLTLTSWVKMIIVERLREEGEFLS